MTTGIRGMQVLCVDNLATLPTVSVVAGQPRTKHIRHNLPLSLPPSLGLPDSIALTGGFFGRGTGNIYLDEVHCVRSEARLADCAHAGLEVHNCRHDEDAGVLCQGQYQAMCIIR